MKEIHLTKGPFIKTNNRSKNININIFLALIPLIIFSFYKNGIVLYQESNNLLTLFWPIILMLISSLITLLMDYLIAKLRKENKKFIYFLTHKLSFLPGLIFALMLPIDIPIWTLIIGSIAIPLIEKINYNGNNLFNQVVVALLIVLFINSSNLFKTTSVTDISLWSLFFGNANNALVTTNSFLVLLAFLFLVYKKAIKWRIPITYILIVFIMTYIIGILNNQTMYYPLFHVLSGSSLFIAVFLASDNKTSPTTAFGQITYAAFLGILTIIFRFYVSDLLCGLLSILIMNIFNQIIDEIGALARFGLKKGAILILVQIVLILGISLYIAENNEIGFDNIVKSENL